MLANHEAVPVTAGLVVGIAFIIVFSSLPANPAASINDSILTPRRHISAVIISEGALYSHGNFEPEIIKVVLGLNNTVRWINEDLIAISVVASRYDDTGFYNATVDENGKVREQNLLLPNQTFEYTFVKTGVFDYNGVPHPDMQGTVVVLAPGMVDNITESLIDQRLTQKIVGVPLTVYVGNNDEAKPLPDGSLPVYAVQGFVLDKPTNLISTNQIQPSWKGGKSLEDVNGSSETTDALKDRNGNSIARTYTSNNNTLLTINAVCPSTTVTYGDDGTIGQLEASKETAIYYGPKVTIGLDNNASGIIYYEYSLGQVEPVAYGFYRLTFVSPYEASIRLSNQLQLASYEQSGCTIVGGPEDGTTLPYYDIIFEFDEMSDPSNVGTGPIRNVETAIQSPNIMIK